MDFGSLADLDDSLFESKKKEVVKISLKSYNAKFCEPYWFSSSCVDAAGDTSQDAYKLRYSADVAFKRKQFKAAITQYESALQKLLLPSSSAIRRDIEEAVVRCHMNLGHTQQAEELAQALHKDSQNYEQKTSTLKLLIDVHRSMNNFQGELLYVQQLAALHPLNADVWIQLAHLYSSSSAWKSPDYPASVVNDEAELSHHTGHSLSSSVNDNANVDTDSRLDCDKPCIAFNDLHISESNTSKSHDSESSSGNVINEPRTVEINRSKTQSEESQVYSVSKNRNDDRSVTCNCFSKSQHTPSSDRLFTSHQASYTCLKRALLILKSVEHSVASFVKTANQETQRKLSEKLAVVESHISPDEQARCLKFLTRDVFMEQSELDSAILQEADIESPAFQEKFERKWFSWALPS